MTTIPHSQRYLPHDVLTKYYACNQSYNNQKIGQMLLDDRSEYMYPKGSLLENLMYFKQK